jgi:hypothetical protein
MDKHTVALFSMAGLTGLVPLAFSGRRQVVLSLFATTNAFFLGQASALKQSREVTETLKR